MEDDENAVFMDAPIKLQDNKNTDLAAPFTPRSLKPYNQNYSAYQSIKGGSQLSMSPRNSSNMHAESIFESSNLKDSAMAQNKYSTITRGTRKSSNYSPRGFKEAQNPWQTQNSFEIE